MGLGNFWASIIAVVITGCILIAVAVGVVKCLENGEESTRCDFRSWEVTAEPLDGKGLVNLKSYDSFYLELPFKTGDTITRWFDDNQWNLIINTAEKHGVDVSKYKYKVVSIKKNCR